MGKRVKNLIEAMEFHLAEKEQMEKQKGEYEAMEKAVEEEKKSVTIRMDPWQIKNLDLLVEKLDSSRSALVCDLATSALFDAIEDMGFTDEFFKKITEGIEPQREKKEVA